LHWRCHLRWGEPGGSCTQRKCPGQFGWVRRGGWAGQVRRANVRCRKKIAGVPLRSGAAETSSSSGHILKCPATQPTGRVSLKYRFPSRAGLGDAGPALFIVAYRERRFVERPRSLADRDFEVLRLA